MRFPARPGNQMVDIKVCAVDDVWSGLKFVYRVKDRIARS